MCSQFIQSLGGTLAITPPALPAPTNLPALPAPATTLTDLNMHESEFPLDFFIDKLPATPQRPTNSGPSMEPPSPSTCSPPSKKIRDQGYMPTPSLAPVLEQTPLFQLANATVSVPMESHLETPVEISLHTNPQPPNTSTLTMSPTPGPPPATMGAHHMGSCPHTTQPQPTLPQPSLRDAPPHSTPPQQMAAVNSTLVTPSPSAISASAGPNPYAPA
ncbi:hypothetical protein ACA910_005874 [Epithemia clementina (nom. ined.)]